jgi:hypothetical protein
MNGEIALGFVWGFATLLLGIVIVGSVGFTLPTEATIDYVDKHEGFFVALFTLALFVATTALWRSTRKVGDEQIAQLKASSERQLRAYVYLDNAHFKYVDAGHWEITYKIRNSGRTPAHSVRVSAGAEVVEWNNALPELSKRTSASATMGSMAPGGDFFESIVSLEGFASPDELSVGAKAIYLVGEIRYSDVFQSETRRTNFRYYIGGDVGCDGNEMFADEAGNDAT